RRNCATRRRKHCNYYDERVHRKPPWFLDDETMLLQSQKFCEGSGFCKNFGRGSPLQIFRNTKKGSRAQLEKSLHRSTRYAFVRLNDRTKLSIATPYILTGMER
ncbi:MAG: hypothetical protein WBE29_00090, partial [Pseudolabrys sp.]